MASIAFAFALPRTGNLPDSAAQGRELSVELGSRKWARNCWIFCGMSLEQQGRPGLVMPFKATI